VVVVWYKYDVRVVVVVWYECDVRCVIIRNLNECPSCVHMFCAHIGDICEWRII